MKINSIQSQSFGMARISDGLRERINDTYSEPLAKRMISDMQNTGSQNTLVADAFACHDGRVCKVKFPEKYNPDPAAYIFKLIPSTPIKKVITDAENKFFHDVVDMGLKKLTLRDSLESLKADFPERIDMLNELHEKCSHEMRNQDEMLFLRSSKK